MINQVEEHFLARDTDVDGENKAGRHEQNQNPPDNDDDNRGGLRGALHEHEKSLVGTLVFRPCEVLAPPLLPYLVRACVSRLYLSGGVLAARKGTRSTHDTTTLQVPSFAVGRSPVACTAHARTHPLEKRVAHDGM